MRGFDILKLFHVFGRISSYHFLKSGQNSFAVLFGLKLFRSLAGGLRAPSNSFLGGKVGDPPGSLLHSFRAASAVMQK